MQVKYYIAIYFKQIKIYVKKLTFFPQKNMSLILKFYRSGRHIIRFRFFHDKGLSNNQ